MKKMLTKAEEQVMQAVWKLGKAGLRDIINIMPEPKAHQNTVATILKILTDKGFIVSESIGRMNLYSPTVEKDSYSNSRIENLANFYFDGSFQNMISSMVENKKVSITDLELLIANIKKP